MASGISSLLITVLFAVAFIALPISFYIFFMVIKCPPNPFRRHRRRLNSNPDAAGTSSSSANKIGDNMVELVTDLKYNKEEDAKDCSNGECPVCLSVFVDGEDVRQLKACKHVFHGACIDMWLQSHSNCPVCRGSVPVKRSVKKPVRAGRDRDDDFRQGLPDSASLV